MIALLKPYFAASKKLLALILVLGVTTVVFSVGLMFVAGYLISASADNAFSLLMLNIPLAFVQIFGLGKPIASYFERLKSHDWVLRLTSKMRWQLFRAVQKSDREDAPWKTGEVLGSLASDIEGVQNLFLRVIFPVLISWIAGLILVVIAGVFSWMLLAFALGMMVVLCVFVPLLALALDRARLARLHRDRAQLYARVTDTVLGVQDVTIAGRGDEVSARFEDAFDQVAQEERVLRRRGRVCLLIVQVLLLVSLLVILWWSVTRFGEVPGGPANWIIALALGFFPLIEVFAPLSQQFEDGFSHRESLIRLSEKGVLEEEAQQDRHDSPASSAIECKELSFGYDAPNSCLRDISLEIPAGQKVAVLGKSGSGKTTLARLLHAELDPNAGVISVGGIPVRDLHDDIWNYVGYISQDSYVFAMSIWDNLRIGNIEVTEQQAWEALEAVGLKELVAAMPDGLESLADEAGLNLSGGQAQRLALARMLLQDPSIVVFDEPTVGLDPITEQLVMDTIDKVFAQKTVVFITHHLQGIERFDRVLFMEDGAIVMDGAPAVLAQQNERFKRLLAFDRGLSARSA